MNLVGDYDDLDMTGIDPAFYARVPADAQRRVVNADSSWRLIWNSKAERYQILYREPSVVQKLDDGWLRGWQIIATFTAPLNVTDIVTEMRRRADFMLTKLAKMGYASLEEYLDDDSAMEKATDDLISDAVDDYMDGAMARSRDEEALIAKRRVVTLDEASGRRHVRRGKVLFLPPGMNPKSVTNNVGLVTT